MATRKPHLIVYKLSNNFKILGYIKKLIKLSINYKSLLLYNKRIESMLIL
jgi:hypothetical protein